MFELGGVLLGIYSSTCYDIEENKEVQGVMALTGDLL